MKDTGPTTGMKPRTGKMIKDGDDDDMMMSPKEMKSMMRKMQKQAQQNTVMLEEIKQTVQRLAAKSRPL